MVWSVRSVFRNQELWIIGWSRMCSEQVLESTRTLGLPRFIGSIISQLKEYFGMSMKKQVEPVLVLRQGWIKYHGPWGPILDKKHFFKKKVWKSPETSKKAIKKLCFFLGGGAQKPANYQNIHPWIRRPPNNLARAELMVPCFPKCRVDHNQLIKININWFQ